MAERADWKVRELEILALLTRGLSDRAIAKQLRISPQTVRWYNKQIYARLEVSNRTQAVHRAAALGLLDVPVPPAPRPPVPRSSVRYADNGGISIAWMTIGSGPVDLLFIHGFLSHLEAAWEESEFTAFFEQLGQSARIILFDKRGVGLSDRLQGAPTIEQTIADALCVLDAAGSKRAFVSGTSEGGAAAVLLASMHPHRVRGLILIAATPCVVNTGGDPPWAVPRHDFDQRIAMMIASLDRPWALERFAPSRLQDERFAAWWSKVVRAAASPSSVRAVLEHVRDIDIRPLVPQVRTRALVVHRSGDRIVPLDAGRWLAHQLPDATFIEMPGEDHIYFIDGAPIATALTDFMSNAEPAEPDTWIAILLAATGPDARPGNDATAVLEATGVRRIHTTRNGWTAVFDAPNRAVQAARLLRDLAHGRGPGLALHIGACSVTEDRPLPAAAEAVQRLGASAGRGEILVSNTLRDILSGATLPLVERGLPAEGAASAPASAWALQDARPPD